MMERLTKRVEDCADPKEIYGVEVKDHDYVAAAHRLAAYEDTDLLPEEVVQMQETQLSGMDMVKVAIALDELTAYRKIGALDRLRELAEADKDGRVVVLPCQSGEHVFALLDDQKHVRECEVKHAVLDGWRKVFFITPVGDPWGSYGAPFGAFGKTVFLTREEAEKALEAMENG